MLCKSLMTAALVFGAAALGPPAFAGPIETLPCFQRADIVEALTKSYREQPAGFGLQGTDLMVELWYAPESGTFTILLSRPDGISCLLVSGGDWQPQPQPRAGLAG
ncbi:MAG: hypothetical protein U1E48_05880 [Paracoccaceae bacterium]